MIEAFHTVHPEWRTASDGLRDVFRQADAICPWSAGPETTIDDFWVGSVKADVHVIQEWNRESGQQKQIYYIPVVFPGLSVRKVAIPFERFADGKISAP